MNVKDIKGPVLGLDVATVTGFALVDVNGELLDCGEYASKFRGDPLKRADDIASMVMRLVQTFSPGLIVIEGYGYANKYSLATLVEIGSIIRYRLWLLKKLFVEVPPTSLKKYVTGKGNSPKEQMMLSVYKKWGVEPKTHNVADAIGLAYLGLAGLGKIRVLKSDLSVVTSVEAEIALKCTII